MPRRKSQSAAGSLDSLLDTMTNVVGILIIMLIVTQLGVGQAVERIKGFVDEVSQEEYDHALAESVNLKALLEELRAEWRDLDPRVPEMRLSLERQQELLQQLQADLERLREAQIDPELLQEQLDERRERVAEIEAEIAEQQILIASLRARLAETPDPGPDQQPKVVNLPNPRPAPEGAQPVIFLCRDGYLMPADTAALQAEGQQVVRGAQRVLIRDDRIDCERLTDLFDKRFVGDRFSRLRIRIGGDAKPWLMLEHREEQGVPTEELTGRSSRFHQMLRQMNSGRHYIDFRVFSDSLDTYIAARNVATTAGFTAGWIPYAANAEYRIPLGENIQTLCVGREPPQPGPSPPLDPDRPPPPPRDVVD